MKKYVRVKRFRIDEYTLEILQHNVEKINKANKKKISESEYIRNLILKDNFEQATFMLDLSTYRDMVRDLAGLGNNINQIAHRMNMDIFDKSDIEEIKKASEQIEAMNNKLDDLYIIINKGG